MRITVADENYTIEIDPGVCVYIKSSDDTAVVHIPWDELSLSLSLFQMVHGQLSYTIRTIVAACENAIAPPHIIPPADQERLWELHRARVAGQACPEQCAAFDAVNYITGGQSPAH